MDELHEPVCPDCDEPLSAIAPRREKNTEGTYIYRGMKLYCKTGGCPSCDTARIQRPITLCPHPDANQKRVPGHEHIEYCGACGVLSPDTQNGWDSKTPPWD